MKKIKSNFFYKLIIFLEIIDTKKMLYKVWAKKGIGSEEKRRKLEELSNRYEGLKYELKEL